ncbi:MAG: hypothetical protein VX739_05570 [Planctomycetota bacterium]|nr:hypothetical protein [Planctomycetota bacterium]
MRKTVPRDIGFPHDRVNPSGHLEKYHKANRVEVKNNAFLNGQESQATGFIPDNRKKSRDSIGVAEGVSPVWVVLLFSGAIFCKLGNK